MFPSAGATELTLEAWEPLHLDAFRHRWEGGGGDMPFPHPAGPQRTWAWHMRCGHLPCVESWLRQQPPGLCQPQGTEGPASSLLPQILPPQACCSWAGVHQTGSRHCPQPTSWEARQNKQPRPPTPQHLGLVSRAAKVPCRALGLSSTSRSGKYSFSPQRLPPPARLPAHQTPRASARSPCSRTSPR